MQWSWYCHCSGPDHCYDTGLNPGLGITTCCGCNRKKKKKWIKYLNIRLDIIKLEENIGRTLSDINHSSILLDPSPRVMKIKTKIKNKQSKPKSFCKARKPFKKKKKRRRQPSEWKKISANEATDKGLISKIQKHFTQIYIKKIKNPIKK